MLVCGNLWCSWDGDESLSSPSCSFTLYYRQHYLAPLSSGDTVTVTFCKDVVEPTELLFQLQVLPLGLNWPGLAAQAEPGINAICSTDPGVARAEAVDPGPILGRKSGWRFGVHGPVQWLHITYQVHRDRWVWKHCGIGKESTCAFSFFALPHTQEKIEFDSVFTALRRCWGLTISVRGLSSGDQ